MTSSEQNECEHFCEIVLHLDSHFQVIRNSHEYNQYLFAS